MLTPHWLNALQRQLQRHWTKCRASRRRRATDQAATAAEILEDKTLLSGGSPIANDDSYTAADDQLDTLAESLASVLANDHDLEGDPLTATLISGPAHGTLTSFGSNGHSVFEPDKTYEGTDSYVYEISDGTGTDTATVTLTITKPFGEQLNENDTPVDEVDWYEENYATSRLTGDLQIKHPIGNLVIPANGPRTGGGAIQYQLREGVPIDPEGWSRPPGRPFGS